VTDVKCWEHPISDEEDDDDDLNGEANAESIAWKFLGQRGGGGAEIMVAPVVTKALLLQQWFDLMIENLGCDSPKYHDTVYLHGFTLRGNLFPLMKKYFLANGNKDMVPSKDYFVKVWNKLFGKKGQLIRSEAGKKKVRLRQDVTVGKCQDCQVCIRALKQAKNPESRRGARQAFQAHMGFVYDQRTTYCSHRAAAALGLALSMGTDATSSWFTQLPMPSYGTGSVRPWSRIDNKVTIAVLHGTRDVPEYTARVCTPAWVAGGGNLQITLFFEVSRLLTQSTPLPTLTISLLATMP
jgi:hypothetical protein